MVKQDILTYLNQVITPDNITEYLIANENSLGFITNKCYMCITHTHTHKSRRINKFIP